MPCRLGFTGLLYYDAPWPGCDILTKGELPLDLPREEVVGRETDRFCRQFERQGPLYCICGEIVPGYPIKGNRCASLRFILVFCLCECISYTS